MTELVRNGSFASGLTDWVSDAQNVGTITATTIAGNTYLSGHLGDTSGSNTVSQSFAVAEHISSAAVSFTYHLSNNIHSNDALGLFLVQLTNSETGESAALLVLDGISGTRDDHFTLDFTSALNDLSAGTYTLSFSQQAYGSGADFDFTLDDVSVNVAAFSPSPTVVRVVDDTNYTDDNITRDTTPSLTITGEPGGTIEVFRNGVSVGTATDEGTPGQYTFNSALLADGDYQFTAKLTLPGAPESAASAPLKVTIDHVAPAAPTIMGIENNVMTITAEAGATIVLFSNGEYLGRAYETASKGTFQFALEGRSTDAVVYTGNATDLAGNVSAISSPFLIDTAPVINSDGGGDTATIHIDENTTAVTTVSATDANGNATLRYAITDGADRALFAIDDTTGVLHFINAPDFEAPTSGAGGNTYDVVVQVSDGLLTAQQHLTVMVDDVAKETLRGTSDADTLIAANSDSILYGLGGADVLKSGAGNDRLDGGTGIDTMTGGAGNDIYFVESAGDTVIEAVGGGTDTVYARISYTLGDNVETLIQQGKANLSATGNGLANRITGNAGANELLGMDGNDRIVGGDGNDKLYGGFGRDTLTGGAGADQFVFEALKQPGSTVRNYDTVSDFHHDQGDKIVLDQTFYTAFSALGGISADAFHAGAGLRSAQDASDHLIYDTTSGSLYYDIDGRGGAAGVLVAIFSGQPALDASDFLIVA